MRAKRARCASKLMAGGTEHGRGRRSLRCLFVTSGPPARIGGWPWRKWGGAATDHQGTPRAQPTSPWDTYPCAAAGGALMRPRRGPAERPASACCAATRAAPPRRAGSRWRSRPVVHRGRPGPLVRSASTRCRTRSRADTDPGGRAVGPGDRFVGPGNGCSTGGRAHDRRLDVALKRRRQLHGVSLKAGGELVAVDAHIGLVGMRLADLSEGLRQRLAASGVAA